MSGWISMEKIVRPFAPGSPQLQRLIDAVPPVDSAAEANIRWGGPSDFALTKPDAFVRPSISVTFPDDTSDDPEQEENQALPPVVFTEVDRETETIRVENPDDSEQYVMVKRTLNSTFQPPSVDLATLLASPWKFVFNNDLDG